MINNLPFKLETEINGGTFQECLMICAQDKELLGQIDRLKGTNLLRKGSPIDLAIDDATGRTTSDVEFFVNFCWEYIFLRLPRETTS